MCRPYLLTFQLVATWRDLSRIVLGQVRPKHCEWGLQPQKIALQNIAESLVQVMPYALFDTPVALV